MEYSDLDTELERLEQIHKSYKSSLGRRTKSRAWAVWMLIGGLLAICYRIIVCQKRGDLVGVQLLARLAVEYTEQMRFFADPQTKAEAIKDWWKVYSPLRYDTKLSDIEYRLFSMTMNKKKSVRYTHTSKRKGPEGVSFSQDAATKQLIDLLSLYSYPTWSLTQILFQSDKNNGSYEMYDYRGETLYGDIALPIVKSTLYVASHAIDRVSYLYSSRTDTSSS